MPKVLRPLTEAEIASKFDDKSFTISYSPSDQGWVSFHDYFPYLMWNTRHHVFSSFDESIYKHNIPLVFATYYNAGLFSSLVDVVFNDSPEASKMFGTVTWISEIIDSTNVSIWDKTITLIMCYNAYQCSGDVSLTHLTNLRTAEGTWKFNAFRDLVSDKTLPFLNDKLEVIVSNIDTALDFKLQKRFIDKYIVVRFLIDNIDQNTLYLYDTDIEGTLSAR